MNLKNLNKITLDDLKNIDWARVKGYLQSRPDLAINILLVVITFVVMVTSFQKYINARKSSESEIALLKKKQTVLDKLTHTQKQYDRFIKDVQTVITGDQLIEILSKLALQRDIQILSFSPAKTKSNKFVNLTSVEVNIASENYTNIVLFVNDIESALYSIRIEKWSGMSQSPNSPHTGRSRRFHRQTATISKQNEHIEATIKIKSVELKNV